MTAVLRITLFHCFALLRTPFFVQQAIAAPVVFVLFRLIGALGAGAHVPEDLWLHGSVAGLWASTTTAVGIIGYQRFQGTLEHMAMSVLRPGVVFGGLCASAAMIGLIGVPVALVLQLILTGGLRTEPAAALTLLGALLACVSSGCVLAAVFVVSRAATVFEPLLLTPIWLLSGIVIPFSSLPGWVLPVASIHPLLGAVASYRTDGTTDWFWLGQSAVMSLLWTGGAAALLGAALRKARRDGSLALA
ncbi:MULTISPECIES: ABC transporter permease [unclassified Curtobacterium]|uniref:ABC transporter permease n=1 Tax=unclassified Curtobacterium TaxID=257496 RepID=UPI0027843F27|nr:ABC transporter permease [Curtobacterium sp. 260]MDP9738164.1 ABC-2 type transport system permease protein [Curtobacterium sp. 260]